ncbi:MAG: alcohol dehydrogenase catalytic domain-containing protein [Bifidobacteriaceae bacterium]|jgi:threonine dehydrogenase-like Zn-dependent dehydrogenase|nr:alcohol dehydrogenase catalytic domain-containing protein [Bifidobacteriaceae bacterium]
MVQNAIPNPLPDTVRAVRVASLEDITVETVPAPQPLPGEALLQPIYVGICGSDTHAAAGLHPFIDLPYWPGHEILATVVATPWGVPKEWMGRRVVVEPNLVCGECPQCLAGRYNICRRVAVFGCQTRGALTDLFTIGSSHLVPVPDALSDERAALIEPLATPVHAVRRCGDLHGKRVLVIGAGPIGLLTLVAARRAGAAAVAVSDVLASKRALAERFGATGTVDPTSGSVAEAAAAVVEVLGGPADAVLDCVVAGPTIELGVAVLTKGGRLMVVGVPAGNVSVPLNLVQDRELELVGNLMYTRPDYLDAIDTLLDPSWPAEDLITAVYPLGQAAQAFAAATDPESVKTLVRL